MRPGVGDGALVEGYHGHGAVARNRLGQALLDRGPIQLRSALRELRTAALTVFEDLADGGTLESSSSRRSRGSARARSKAQITVRCSSHGVSTRDAIQVHSTGSRCAAWGNCKDHLRQRRDRRTSPPIGR